MTEAICGAVVLIGIGLLSIFARDLMWELTHWSNSTKGIASERTETWDTWSVLSGVLLAGFGVVILLLMVGSSVQEQREEDAATATASSYLAALDATYAPVIPTLRAEARFEPQEANAAQFGISGAQTLTYGLCGDEDFFLYLSSGLEYRGEAYMQDHDPERCEPDGWGIYSAERLGESALGGDWYSFSVLRIPTYAPLATATRTPTPAP